MDVPDDLVADVERIVDETSFSGVVRVDRGDEMVLSIAAGWAHRPHRIANTIETRFGTASGAKGFTALTVMRLVESGVLSLTTTARSLLGTDLPLIDDAVTVEHLLGHRSGIGDFLDEDLIDDINDHVLTVPAHELLTIESYLMVLDGHPQVFVPGERFAYCNGGYAVLALLAERASGVDFYDLVAREVVTPAGLTATAFLRSDDLPADAAIGYLGLDDDRTNVFHLPIRGCGDGGIYTIATDLHRLWTALFDGRIVPGAVVDEMVRPRSEATGEDFGYGFGFWVPLASDSVLLEGYDAGVSFRSIHHPGSRTTATVMSNTSNGAWPVTRPLRAWLID